VTSRRTRSTSLKADQEHRVARGGAPGTRRLTVIVPAYNEADKIATAVSRLKDELPPDVDAEVVVVDDGSIDDTATRATTAGADHVVRLPQNRGKGAAVRTGVEHATGRTIAYTDADLSYPPTQLLELLEAVEDGWDMVVGSRRHVDTTTLVRARRLREVSGRVFNGLTTLVLLRHYRDTQCGLKAFRSDVARLLFSHGRLDGFAFDVELFYLAERYRLSLKEVPVTLESSATSTVRVVVDASRMVTDLFKVRLWAARNAYDRPVQDRERLPDPK
jgi:dolichyl-phosphate beta-glucosyltransferase